MSRDEVEILLVEDNPDDVDLTLHAFRKHNLSNQIHVVRDGADFEQFVEAVRTLQLYWLLLNRNATPGGDPAA